MATKTTTTRTKNEPKTRKRETADPEQYKRFREFAREIEADDNPEVFDRKFRQIVPPHKG
jgi:hypothetical protein